MPTPNLNPVKGLSNDQEFAAQVSSWARQSTELNLPEAIYFQEKSAAEYEACRSVYQLLFQQSIEINHD